MEVGEAVATFTLNRPERLNAVTPQMVDALDAALAEAIADDAVRVIRLRGAGRAFCSGYDLEWSAQLMHEGDQAGPWDPAATGIYGCARALNLGRPGRPPETDEVIAALTQWVDRS